MAHRFLPTFDSARARTLALGVILAATAAGASPALAQPFDGPPGPPPGVFVPRYEHWQPRWDRDDYDRHHVILGTVAGFEPFRLQLAHPDGNVQTIDLKNGTVIRPTGATPQQGQRVAVIGYFSRGTFIANRVILRDE